ncbi:hypothetical protein [Pseudooceanicola sp.]|nr:hypothetical protein [Pseudooceanicola sp.]MDF1854563.1 hypothetical protein [Pseudooceanicola sp.]
MFAIFSEYLAAATLREARHQRELRGGKPDPRGRWRASPNWRNLPEDF